MASYAFPLRRFTYAMIRVAPVEAVVGKSFVEATLLKKLCFNPNRSRMINNFRQFECPADDSLAPS